jgi:hypothetical protein
LARRLERLALLPLLPVPELMEAPEPEPVLLLMLEPEFTEPELLPVLPAVLAAAPPAVEPCAAAPPVPPPGVPVWPIGVPWLLRWPAPVAGSAAGRGGVPWAKAKLTVAAATAAARNLSVDM